MTINEVIRFAKEQFRDHIATISQPNEYTQEIEFKKPATEYCYIKLIFSRDYLFICGSLGEAVYRFDSQVCIENVSSNYCLSFFASNLIVGNQFSFDCDVAASNIVEHMKDLEREGLERVCGDAYKKLVDLVMDCNTAEQWYSVLEKHKDLAFKASDDWWEWLPSVGNQINTSIIMHWVALKLAGKQIGCKVGAMY